MIRESFQNDLDDLRNKVLEMGNLVEEALEYTVISLKKRDNELAQKVIEGDRRIDELEMQIEKKSLSLIALQQPMAKDLRFLGTALKINTDLERMGDYAADVAKTVIQLGDEPYIKPLIDLPRMADISREMIRGNLKAYIDEDSDLAVKTAELDHEIDHLYNQIFRELLILMGEDARNIKQSTYLLLMARYFERVGDHATNVSEWIVYMITGERPELNE